MATYTERYSDNAPGLYYVDMDCIACDTCFNLAPLHFKLTNNHEHAIVTKQPTTPSEKEVCEAAVAACPVEAIGNDGEVQ